MSLSEKVIRHTEFEKTVKITTILFFGRKHEWIFLSSDKITINQKVQLKSQLVVPFCSVQVSVHRILLLKRRKKGISENIFVS